MGIKLSISNIAWSHENDQQVYKYMQQAGFAGLEIAPTRLFPNTPYKMNTEAADYARNLYKTYELEISSVQSIWYGRKERLFGPPEEREFLIDYSKQAIEFAGAVEAKNLVFGNPKNRYKEENDDMESVIKFFKQLGDYAVEHGTVLSIEPNPEIYGTNFINNTKEAVSLVEEVNSEGFKINFDYGSFLFNEENIEDFISCVDAVNHVHISEIGLNLIKKREEHKDIFKILRDGKYDKYISIEMNRHEIDDVYRTIDYLASL